MCDAVLQAAVEEGIVPGGGVALLYASKTLEEVKSKNASFDQKIGVDIVQKALQMPLKTIANNAGAAAYVSALLVYPRDVGFLRMRCLAFLCNSGAQWAGVQCCRLYMDKQSQLPMPLGQGALMWQS